MRKDYSYGLDSFWFFSHLFDQRRLCSRKSDIKECLKAPAHREPQETFNSLSKVLFIFPSWYLFAIGLEPAFGFKNEIYHLIYAPIPRSVTLRASTGIWRLRTVRIEPKNESCRGRTVPKNEPNRHPPTVRFMKTEPNRTVVTLKHAQPTYIYYYKSVVSRLSYVVVQVVPCQAACWPKDTETQTSCHSGCKNRWGFPNAKFKSAKRFAGYLLSSSLQIICWTSFSQIPNVSKHSGSGFTDYIKLVSLSSHLHNFKSMSPSPGSGSVMVHESKPPLKPPMRPKKPLKTRPHLPKRRYPRAFDPLRQTQNKLGTTVITGCTSFIIFPLNKQDQTGLF